MWIQKKKGRKRRKRREGGEEKGREGRERKEKKKEKKVRNNHILYYNIEGQYLVLLVSCSLTCIFNSCPPIFNFQFLFLAFSL